MIPDTWGKEDVEAALKTRDKEISELKQMVRSEQAKIDMCIFRMGGKIEGKPTHKLNFLQRVDHLRICEDEVSEQKQAIHDMSKMICKLEMIVIDNYPGKNEIHEEIIVLFENCSIKRVI